MSHGKAQPPFGRAQAPCGEGVYRYGSLGERAASLGDSDRRETGAGNFKTALRRLALAPERGERPKPGSSWEVWIEYRVECLEDGQRWMQRVILGALILEVGLQVVQMVH